MIVALDHQTPPERLPPSALAWMSARIERATASDGPWTTLVAAFTLDPPVSDPAHPPTYSFTVADTTTTQDWYRVVWIDTAANEQPGPAVHNGEPTDADIRPTVDDVAALLAARTTDANGVEVGTFTANTRPTAAQVSALIDQALTTTKAALQWPITDRYAADARDLVALQAALLVESSFYRGELDADDNVFRQYQAMYLNGVQSLRANLAPVPIL